MPTNKKFFGVGVDDGDGILAKSGGDGTLGRLFWLEEEDDDMLKP
ncbi:hypothetical protein Tco_1432308, partial [Tanacetum coccineum]